MRKLLILLVLFISTKNTVAAQSNDCLAENYTKYINNRIKLFTSAKNIMAKKSTEAFIAYSPQFDVSISAAHLNKIAFKHLVSSELKYLKSTGKVPSIVPTLKQYLAYSQGKPVAGTENKIYLFLKKHNDFNEAYSAMKKAKQAAKSNTASINDKRKAHKIYKAILDKQLKNEFELEKSFFKMDVTNLTCE